ncbi:MAG: hypothetical protein GW839_06735 [Flavobacteriales bacterium]|nr:hypothetical protein [Flavobacteriia bacterium]NCP05562.1 hypothetical protein [Flavobacteriales bacterium]PIV93506.1 MAG: hypothetical protein COW44_09110 [Flavobacteriaceae bacterium CG17_big_fil_post_rev_8_21_14_2_50_33_15]PIY10561.1 MAG: hypothetical protein COZ17_09510 [Flavobacteriaceae bacterium CG_4_10_14_3_um_filter_33_47]PJB17975.1 MAG: hypothetical protein CO117_09570 [Flavobacteriaceae bacterium CG_4_9_14_3_um_filter_33_16]
MAQDIRELLKNDLKKTQEFMPENHQDRFLKKLDIALPVKKKPGFNGLNIAASTIILLGLCFGAFKYFQPKNPVNNQVISKTIETKSLGDVSPGLKKVEDYYLATINLELSKMKYTPETKDVFDGYLKQLDILNKEYENLSVELTENGPSELTVNALIDNLKYRLNLLYRLREQLNELNASKSTFNEASQSI